MAFKNLIKKASALLLSVCTALMLLTIPVSADLDFHECVENCHVYDMDDMMSEQDLAEANALLQKTCDDINMYIAVAISENAGFSSDWEQQVAADDLYDELFNPKGSTGTDGLLLYVDYGWRYAYITTCGMGELYYYNGASDDRISRMISNLTTSMQHNDYLGIVEQFCNDAKYYASVGVPKNAFTYNVDDGLYRYEKHGEIVASSKLPLGFGVNWPLLLLIAGIFAVVGFLISFLLIGKNYKLHSDLSPTNYVSHKESKFFVREDVFMGKHTTSRYIDRSGGGGGGGSSHSSSGGFSHGGGGGHF